MYISKIKKKLDSSVYVRVEEDLAKELDRLFEYRHESYKDKFRTKAEFLRWVLTSFVATQRQQRRQHNMDYLHCGFGY